MLRGAAFSLLLASAILSAPGSGLAQGTTPPRIRDSNVGYIDSAIPGSYLRFQVDSAFNNVRPTRDEFFWSPGPPQGRGPTLPERSVDYTDLYAQIETAVLPTTSLFVGV